MDIYCGNNALHRSLKVNGGNKTFGTHDQCFKKGYGIGYNAPVGDISQFMAEWGPYKPYIVQKLVYVSGNVPPGYQRAILAQSLQRGFALGRVARAKSMSREAKASPKASASKHRPSLPLRNRKT